MSSPNDQIKPYATIRTYKKGANLFFQGEAPRRGVMIADGIVRSYTITTSGEERTLSFFTRDDILPLSWLMGTTSTSLFYYEAVTDARVLQFDREDFKTHVMGDHESLLGLFTTISRDQTAAMLRINGLEQSRAEEKIAFTLYYLIFRYGTPPKTNDGFHVINLPLRHTTIAGLVGLSRESTTRILGKLQTQHIIDYSGTEYKIHKDRLESHIGEDAFRDVSLR